MKLFELGSDTLKQDPAQQIAGKATASVAATPAIAPVETGEPLYADWAQTKLAAVQLAKLLPNADVKMQNATGVKPVPHIRISKTSPQEIKAAIDGPGLNSRLDSADAVQSKVSGKYSPYSFEVNGITYTLVLSTSRSGDDSKIGINRKELSPTNLGLAGQSLNRHSLIAATRAALEKNIRDEQLRAALLQLLDNAARGGKGKLDPALAEYIFHDIGTISQDFGEILAPLMVMDDNDEATFPVGNSPLVDVLMKKGNMSVKALTGSGTSFRTIADLMDKYESSISKDKKQKERFNILKQFHPSAPGLNVDKIISASATANIPEYTKMTEILGGKFTSHKELINLVSKVITKGANSYKDFLTMMLPAMEAGDWGLPVGLPADGKFHMGTGKAKEKEKVAGKPSYEANPPKGGADILTYVLGQGLARYITKGKDKEYYSTMMTDIVKQSNAVLGHITIKADGSIVLVTKPFSALEFQFQYHAPSHIPGNNLPGFIAVLE